MQATTMGSDGLQIAANVRLSQVNQDELLAEFADGLLPEALRKSTPAAALDFTLAEALHHHDQPELNGLLIALLVLDAEVSAVVNDKIRVFPLTGFLSYRARLPLEEFPLSTLRLPPLNPDGHYLFASAGDDSYLAVRMDIHPELMVIGHARIAIGGLSQAPRRIQEIEQRLDRQILDENLIKAAIAAGEAASIVAVGRVEPSKLTELLRSLL